MTDPRARAEPVASADAAWGALGEQVGHAIVARHRPAIEAAILADPTQIDQIRDAVAHAFAYAGAMNDLGFDTQVSVQIVVTLRPGRQGADPE